MRLIHTLIHTQARDMEALHDGRLLTTVAPWNVIYTISF